MMKNKLTIPQSILIGSLMIAGTILYTNGFNYSIIPKVKAEVAGMDEYDLKNDSDFEGAVEGICTSIIEGYGYQTRSDVRRRVESYGYRTEGEVEDFVNGFSVYVSGSYGSLSC